jgi:hypothetical protein
MNGAQQQERPGNLVFDPETVFDIIEMKGRDHGISRGKK